MLDAAMPDATISDAASLTAVAERLREQICDAQAQGRTLRIRGGGSKDWYGGPLRGDILDTRAYSGVVAYEPTELVITARCGTPWAEIEALLAQHRQMLAFEPPRFGAASTIGGVVAAALSGPRRASAGAVRDFVLGAVLMDGRGEALRFGGQVMKNVAGYDVARLLAGSFGTLGLILEVSLKVLPLPVCEVSLQFACDQAEALARLNTWAGQPLPLSASCWHDGVLTVRLSGASAAVAAAQRRLGGDVLDEAAAHAHWSALRDQTHGFFAGEAAATHGSAGAGAGAGASLWRLSVPPHAGVLALPGSQLIEWGGAQRWFKPDPGTGTGGVTAADSDANANANACANADADANANAQPGYTAAQALRQRVAAVGGHATLYRAHDKRAGAFHPLAPAVAAIHARLRASFDPAGVFNTGRLY